MRIINVLGMIPVKYRITIYLFSFLTILFPALLQAQNTDMAAADFFGDAPIVLFESRMSKPRSQVPVSVSVIDRALIESSGVTRIADIFRLAPGFLVGDYVGNLPVVTYQGLGGKFIRQLQVLIDGQSVFVPSNGGVPWNNLPLLLEDIERVEIIRGPNAVTYGSSAFLATINIITRHSAEDIGSRYAISTNQSSNKSLPNNYFRIGKSTERVGWRLSAGYLADSGFDSRYDSRKTNKINFRMDYQAANNQFWTVHAGTNVSTNGRNEPLDDLDIDRDEDATYSYFNTNWELIGDSITTAVRLTYSEQDINDFSISDPIDFQGTTAFTIYDLDILSNRTDLEIQQTWKPSPEFRLVYGLRHREDRIKSPYLFNRQEYQQASNSQLFGSIEYSFGEGWILDIGTTVEDSSLFDQEVLPRVSIIRRLNANHVLRLVASHAKRIPVIYEQTGLTFFPAIDPETGNIIAQVKTFQGDADVIPEEITAYEIGLYSQSLMNGLDTDIRLFSYEAKNLVDTANEGFLLQIINNADVKVEGLELSLNARPSSNWTIKSGFSFVRPETEDRNTKASFPRTTAFVNSQYNWQRRHSFSATAYYIDEMEWLDSRFDTEPITKLDLRYAFSLDTTTETRLEIIGRNVTGSYQDYFAENKQERVYLLRISGGF